jgi:CBS domain-containing protein
MFSIKQILEKKGRDIWVISPQAKVFDALKLMSEKNIGALIVVDKGRVAGVISERDYARRVILEGKSSKDVPVKQIMTPHVYGIHPETTAEECMALMTDKHIRHLPVIYNDRLLGVVSIGDIVKAIISEQEVTIEHLKNYIMGKYM